MLLCTETQVRQLQRLLQPFALKVMQVSANSSIPGSFWGDPEAGLIGDILYVRDDTPLHSALHEACHFICMDEDRRRGLHTNAGGDYLEENGVCFLQILLADQLPGYGRETIMTEMDRWGYSFRLGSARQWFFHDAEDARDWLVNAGILSGAGDILWVLRRTAA